MESVNEITTEAVPETPLAKTKKQPSKVTVADFREGFRTLARGHFEDWCSTFQLNAARRYQEAKQTLCAMKRIGLPQEVWQADVDMVQVWGEQLAESEVLNGASCEEIALDYSDPVVLKYLALYLWVDGNDTHKAWVEMTGGPIDWSRVVADDLLQAKVFSE